ncbi:MAG TPA: hypothetical protein VF645_02165 [Allosphingosinicella sp.]
MAELKQVGIDVEVNRMIEAHRRGFSESANDILRRVLPFVPPPGASQAPIATHDGSAPAARAPGQWALDGHVESARTASAGTRSRGQWAVEIEGRRIPVPNLKAAYRTLLLSLEERHPDFLSRFAEEKGRSRRFVAQTPGGLYTASPHLAKKHAEPLVDGWYFDSNLSTDQAARRSRIAARLCGLRYGADVRILENLREI